MFCISTFFEWKCTLERFFAKEGSQKVPSFKSQTNSCNKPFVEHLDDHLIKVFNLYFDGIVKQPRGPYPR